MPRETIQVRYVLAPKQRVMYDIVNKAQNLTLPVIAVNMTSISRDSSRVFNKLDGIYNIFEDNNTSSISMPIPINIEVSMSILARYMQDLEQILSNFVPYSNPYIILSWKEPTSVTSVLREIRSEVLWNGNITLGLPTELAASDKIRITADTSFTIKGWLFKNKNELANQIYFIDTNFIATRGELIITDTDYDSYFNSLSSIVETVSLSGTPSISNIYYSYQGNLSNLNEVIDSFKLDTFLNVNNNFVLYGSNYNYTDKVLLSSSNSSYNNTSLSSKYTGNTTGYLLSSSQYSVLNDNMISLNLNNLPLSGNFNIIISNPAGWVSSYAVNAFTFSI